MRCVILTACLLCGGGGGTAVASEKYRLEEPADDPRVFGVGLRLDVHGKVQTLGEQNQTTSLPLSASAAISYRERRLLGHGADAEALRSVRDYEQAQVDITVDEEKTAIRLSDALKLAVAQGRSSGLEIYSLTGLLSAEELELLSPPCDSLGFLALLPKEEVAVGDEWSPPAWVGQFLARLDAVTKADVKCKLVNVQDQLAKVTFSGSATGAVLGAPSEVTFQGSYEYDLQVKAITGVEMRQSEKRGIGVVSVGLDVAAGLRVLRKPAKVAGRVSLQPVIDAAIQPPPEAARLLRFESPWNIGLLHSRDWHLFKQTEQVAIFRLLDQGLFVAQCNLSPIPSAKPGEHTTAAVFEDDIRRSLGTRLVQLKPTEILPTGDRRHLQRAVAQGLVGDRKLTWIYYLLADPSGKQVSLMFAVDSDAVEKLGQRDLEFVQSVRFGAPPTMAILKSPPR
uniref:DUF2066 domain-containing protein n=1 Tax=Schlesneria paludicola TaxID=360056 RepID=A0A7C4LLS7_9PLAN